MKEFWVKSKDLSIKISKTKVVLLKLYETMLKLWHNSLTKHVTTLSAYKMSVVCGKDNLNVLFKIPGRLDLVGLGRISSPRNRNRNRYILNCLNKIKEKNYYTRLCILKKII